MSTRLTRSFGRVPASVMDGALVVVFLLAQLAPFVSEPTPSGHRAWSVLIFAPVIVSTVPLIWRRHAPFAVLIVSELGLGAYDFFPGGPRQPIWYAALVAMFTLAAQAPRWQRVSALAFIGSLAVLVTGSLETAARGVLMWLTAYAMGRAWAARGAQAEALRERARHLEDERELEAARERARISRDVHDILGHGVSVMIAQAEAGPVFIGRDNARVEATFDAITAAGREAMSQLRRILDVLGDRSEHPAPRPTLSDLASLAAQVTASGVRVELVESTPAGTLSADAQVAAYRIAQEALTNTLKHARGVPEPVEAHVDLDWSDGSMAMTITDNGSGGTVGNSGRGLVGIAERAGACGGSASCGPRSDARGFRVSVRLPAEGAMPAVGAR